MKKKIVLFVGLSLIFVTGITAQESEDLVWNEDDSGTKIAKVEGWQIEKDVDLFTDQNNVSIWSYAVEGEAGLFVKQPIVLFIRCDNNELDLFINWRVHLGLVFDFDDPNADKKQEVMHRIIPGNEAEENIWSRSTDHEATFYRGSVEGLVHQMISAESSSEAKLVARTTPRNESSITAVWKLEGITRAIEPLRQICNLETDER